MSEYKKMLSGGLYRLDEELAQLMKASRLLLDEFNQTSFADFEQRNKIAHQLFGHVGKNAYINKPFYCDYGKHIHVGDNFYANFDCVFLDVNEIIIGDNVLLAPRVNIYTAGHPIDPEVRTKGYEFGKKVVIGNDCWIGGNVVINPGVTIGSNVIIGSGSVVTKDIPSNVIALGNPCKVVRAINDDDKTYWQNELKKYLNEK